MGESPIAEPMQDSYDLEQSEFKEANSVLKAVIAAGRGLPARSLFCLLIAVLLVLVALAALAGSNANLAYICVIAIVLLATLVLLQPSDGRDPQLRKAQETANRLVRPASRAGGAES